MVKATTLLAYLVVVVGRRYLFLHLRQPLLRDPVAAPGLALSLDFVVDSFEQALFFQLLVDLLDCISGVLGDHDIRTEGYA